MLLLLMVHVRPVCSSEMFGCANPLMPTQPSEVYSALASRGMPGVHSGMMMSALTSMMPSPSFLRPCEVVC